MIQHMSESNYSGYILDTRERRPDVNAPGGFRSLYLIAIAKSAADAVRIARGLRYSNCEVLEWGPDILDQARAAAVSNDDARFLPD